MVRTLKFPPMLKEVIHNVLEKPFTQKYPWAKVLPPTGFRGKQIFDPAICISCGLCARDCPSKAIEMVEVRGKKKPFFHLDQCVFCYQCAESCAKGAITVSGIFEMAVSDKKELFMKTESQQLETEEHQP